MRCMFRIPFRKKIANKGSSNATGRGRVSCGRNLEASVAEHYLFG